MDKSTLTLQAALDITYRDNWQHRRDKGSSLMSQAVTACLSLVSVHRGAMAHNLLEGITVDMVTADMVRDATAQWYRDGRSPATITKRLNCLSVLGVNVDGLRPPKENKLKWWLRPEEEDRAVAHLAYGPGYRGILADIIMWTTKTGLRIEESLRLRWSDVADDFSSITIPGLKTASSQATLPLGAAPQRTLKRRFATRNGINLVFQITYRDLEAGWSILRADMRWTDDGATLKALRRSAARYLHVDCNMPLDMVRQYLRHENIETTLGYLRLTGGYGTEEMRRYLK